MEEDEPRPAPLRGTTTAPHVRGRRDWPSLERQVLFVLAGGVVFYVGAVSLDLGNVLFGPASFLAVLDLSALALLTLYMCSATLVLAYRDARRGRQHRETMRAHAARVDQMKDQDARRQAFLAEITHELNMPLTPMDLHLDLLAHGKHGDLTAEQHQAIAMVRKSMKRLSKLIADMLDMTRIESGRLRLNTQELRPARLVDEAAKRYVPMAEAAGVKLTLAIDDAARAAKAEIDEARMAQVLDNLITNALKFTPIGGEVTVTCRATPDTVYLSVDDTGRGLDPDDIDAVFEPFEQVDATATPANSGVGLGLYIVRALVQAHGGTITCHSDGLGYGTTFEVALPAVPRVRAEGARKQTIVQPPRAKRSDITPT